MLAKMVNRSPEFQDAYSSESGPEESSKTRSIASSVFRTITGVVPTGFRAFVVSSLMIPALYLVLQTDRQNRSQGSINLVSEGEIYGALCVGYGMLMGSAKVYQLALIFLLPNLLPGVSALDCIRFPNGTIAHDPIFQNASGVVDFFGNQIKEVPKSMNSYGFPVYGTYLQKVFRSLSSSTQFGIMQFTWNGYKNPNEVDLKDQVSPEKRAFLRWLATIFSNDFSIRIRPDFEGRDPGTCSVSSPSLFYCSNSDLYSCEDGSLKGTSPCVGMSGSQMTLNGNGIDIDLSKAAQCGRRTFNQSSLIEGFFIGDSLFPIEQCQLKLKALSMEELNNLGLAIYDYIGDSGPIYPSLSRLYGMAQNEYEMRGGEGSQSVAELDPCPTGELLCSEQVGENCDGGDFIFCRFPYATRDFVKTRWKILRPPTPRSSSDSRTQSSSAQSVSASSSISERSVSGSREASLSTSATRSDSGRSLSLSERISLTFSRLFHSRTNTIPLSFEGNCTLYAQYLQNPAIGAFLSGITCGPGGSTRVDLRNRGISASQAEMLAPALEQLTNITEMIIFGNNLGPNGTASVAQSISKMRFLTYLHVSDNQMGDFGSTALANAIKGIQNLVLILSNNNIGPVGGKALARDLLSVGVKELYVGKNSMGDEVCLMIADAINHPPFPSIVELAPNNYSLATKGAISQMLSSNVSDLRI